MAKTYGKRPSELLGVEDPYTAYCFDEVCLYIKHRREAGDTPVYKTHVSSMMEFYDEKLQKAAPIGAAFPV